MRKNILLILSCFFMLASCVSQLKIQKADNEKKYWIIPELNMEATSYIGDSLLREGTSSGSEALILKKDYGTMGVTAYFTKGPYKFIGIATKSINSKRRKVKVYQFDSAMPGMLGTVYPQLLEDEDGNVYYNSTTISTPLLKNEYTKKTVVDVDDYYFEQQLIYTGLEGKILKFTYREFVDGTARPAFNIDATYDMSKENVIRFKGAIIEILNYNNQSIKYKIISGFKTM